MAGRSGVVLGVDFGTSHTVAALSSPAGPGRPLQFESSFLLPSAVYAETDGRLLVGRDAERSARLDPASFEPNPKRSVDDGVILLGSREYQVPDVIAAVLRRVVDEASRVAGAMPAETVLTYPANWAASRKGVLAEAAARAGVPAVTLIAEPVAAAGYFTRDLGHTVPSGGALVVYDFGGGTFDTTVLRRAGDDWEILATDGLTDLGGLDLDAAIVEHLSRTVGASDPDRWRRLVRPADDLARRRHLMFWADARSAKEQLSRSSSAAIHVPLFDVDTHLTREEFERMARPYVERTVDLTMAALQRAGVRPHEVGGVFPVGGSSRIPLAGTLLHQRVGVSPTLVEDPELVVALGSLPAAAPVRPVPPVSAPAGGGPETPQPIRPTSPAAAPAPPSFSASPPLPGHPPLFPPTRAVPASSPRRRRPVAATVLILALLACVLLLGQVVAEQFGR
ncbi:Hsp70 family protein [Phytohabitans sp. LJ34]|uniref:Hsp70 family protein n=1 Tax=Phytohabitans sp. LJ34 TaxID=3452217 RepID=UPI003F8866F1